MAGEEDIRREREGGNSGEEELSLDDWFKGATQREDSPVL